MSTVSKFQTSATIKTFKLVHVFRLVSIIPIQTSLNFEPLTSSNGYLGSKLSAIQICVPWIKCIDSSVQQGTPKPGTSRICLPLRSASVSIKMLVLCLPYVSPVRPLYPRSQHVPGQHNKSRKSIDEFYNSTKWFVPQLFVFLLCDTGIRSKSRIVKRFVVKKYKSLARTLFA